MNAPAELSAQFSLAALSLSKSADPHRVASAMLDAWDAPAISKADADDPDGAGAHGHPDIARQEKAFYDSLNAGRKEAYDDLMRMVYSLFRRRKPFDVIDIWRVDEPVDAWKRRALQMLLSQPMKAFMLGQVLAHEWLENRQKIKPLMATDVRAIKFLEAYAFSEVSTKFEQIKGTLRHSLIEGIQQGRNPREVAMRMATDLNDYRSDFNMIAITETARAESQGRLQEIADEGEEFAIGSSAYDKRTCPYCKKLIDGKVHRIADIVGLSNYGRKAKDYLPVIPMHPRCRCVWLPFIGTREEAVDRIHEQQLAVA